ncbi:MAG: hypothetical protein H0U21_11385 [Acidimicrobiia bacterium]|nr:hypothetical protein [Acidimicrobiia bacterium]
MARASTTPSDPITRDDLERRFRAVQDGVKGRVEDKRSTLLTVAAAGGLVLVLVVFLLGRKSGKKKTTLVEIRRL